MTGYERVTFKGHGMKRAKTVILRDPREGGTFVTGIEVDVEGDEIARKGFDERFHMIDKGAITKRVPLRMNLIYGELEEV